jgi:hypothetical protein
VQDVKGAEAVLACAADLACISPRPGRYLTLVIMTAVPDPER